jgi:biotin carboxyl carrier protein
MSAMNMASVRQTVDESSDADGGSDGPSAAPSPETRDVEQGLSRSAIVRRRIAALALVLAISAVGLLHRTDRVVRADGRLAPKRWAEIRADGPGEVRATLKRRGDPVRANEPVALLALEGEEAAVTGAEGDLAAARQQLRTVAAQLDRIAEHAVVVPPPSVLDLGGWLEQEVRSRAPAPGLIAEATARMQSIRTELQARAARIRHRDANSDGRPAHRLDRALESRLAQSESQILDALRLVHANGSLVTLDRAMARYEDVIFEGLCDVAHVPPSVVRDVFAARGPVPGEPGQPQADSGPRAPDGYFDLQSELRRTQLDIRQLEAETTSLAGLRKVFPALAGERHGERKALRQALQEFVARSQEARRQREDGLGHDGERLRAAIHRTGEDFLGGVDWAWARIDDGPVSGLADLEHQVSQLHLGFSALERALDRQLAAIASHSDGLIGRNALEEQSVTAEQQAGLFLDAAERLRISAEDLFGKRAGEVELAVAQKQSAVEVVRARLRKAMAVADGAHLPDEQPPLETVRARYASAVARAEWALKAAKLALEAKVVRAPMDGVITSVGLQERSTLARNEVVGVVEDLDGLIFKAQLPERELSDVAMGQRVHLSIEVDDHRQAVEGRVSWVGRGGVVLEKEQHPWNVLVAVEGNSAGLMPALPGRAEIVIGKSSGLARIRALLRRSPSPVRRYLDPELPDPTRVLPIRPEPTPSAPGEQQPAVAARHEAPATTSPTTLVERGGNR